MNNELKLKNLAQWSAYVAKLEKRDNLTAEEKENLEYRRQQCALWAYELKQAEASA